MDNELTDGLIAFCCDFSGGHLMKQQKNKKAKLKERRQRIFKCDEADVQESAIFKKIVAYQRKLLVRLFV